MFRQPVWCGVIPAEIFLLLVVLKGNFQNQFEGLSVI